MKNGCKRNVGKDVFVRDDFPCQGAVVLNERKEAKKKKKMMIRRKKK